MSFNDETLMAYADGELDEAARCTLEVAMQSDPALAARVEQHRRLRSDVFAAFAPVLDEPMPPQLQAIVTAAPPAGVVHLGDARAAKAARLEEQKQRRWSWPQWGAIAAALVVGVLAGRFGVMTSPADTGMASAAVGRDGVLTAQGRLATALSQQLASNAAADASVRIGVSFLSKEGGYCRSFMLGASGAAGLACRQGERWTIPVLAQAAEKPAAAGSYQQAGAAMPQAVLEAIDRRIAGQTLDAAAEQAALQKGWRP